MRQLRRKEQPSHHRQPGRAQRRRCSCLIATATVLELPPIGSSPAPTSCLCTGRNGSAQVALSLVVWSGAVTYPPQRRRIASLERNFGGDALAYSLTTGSNPPQNIRLLSNGISMSASESASIFWLAASRVALSGYSIQLKTTVSSSFAWTAL